jgi:putative ABC transport system permease protein
MTPFRWLGRLARRRNLAASSRQEMQFHVDAAVEALVRNGVPEPDARRRVRLDLGDVRLEVERLADQRPGAGVEALLRDVRHTARSLGRSPTFVIVTVLLVALGVGASTSIFTLVDRVLLRPLPLPGPERIVRIYEASPARGIDRTGVSRGNLAEWRARARQFDAMAVTYVMGRTVSDGDGADVIAVAQVTCDLVAILGISPVLGTSFTEEQCRAARFSSAAAPIGSDPVVMLGFDYWRARHGGDPGIVGRTVLVDRRPFRVIGVMPSEAAAALPGVDAYLAWELQASLPFDQRYTTAFGRLRTGATPRSAQAEVEQIAAEIAGERPQTNRDWTVRVVQIQDDMVRGQRPVLVVLLAAAGLLLVIACANVAILLSTRGLARGHEASLHMALGGSRGRVLLRGLLEAGMITVAGGVLGTLAAFGAVGWLRRSWTDLPRASEVAPDGIVLVFALAVTMMTALAAGAMPALRQARCQPIDALRGGRRSTAGRRAGRLRDVFVTVEVAITVVLLTGAGLLIRSVGGLRAAQPGYDARDVAVAPVFLDSERYRTGAASLAYYEQLFERLRALPGVEAVGGATTLPASEYGPDFTRPVWPAAHAGDDRAVRQASVRIITPGYLEALRIPVVEGRTFDERDAPDGPRVVAISQLLARVLWPGRSPIGEQLVVDYASAGTYPYEVVGVVGDLRFGGPRSEPLEEVYFPHPQRSYLILNVAIRGSPGTAPSPEVVRATLREVDPLKPPQGVYRLSDLLAATYQREHLAMQLLLAFAAAATLLSASGIYGTIAQRVREDRREIGVRLALGASPAAVVGWVTRQVGRVLVRGGLAGLVAAMLGARFLTTMLYGVPPNDLQTTVSVLLLISLIGTMAACLPAYRAARVDPSTALRLD